MLVSEIFRLTEEQKKGLKKLGVETALDLLYHFPSRYVSTGDVKQIRDVVAGEDAVIVGTISKLKTRKAFRSRIPLAEGEISDGTGKIRIVWFNQPYLAKMLHEGSAVKLSGRVTERNGTLHMANPETDTEGVLPNGTTALFSKEMEAFLPVYPESRGINSRWFHYNIKKLLAPQVLEKIVDPLPKTILKKYNLPELKTALVWVHAPKKQKHYVSARKRFAFEEIFYIQLSRQRLRLSYEKLPAYKVRIDEKEIENFTENFPFKPTLAQTTSIERILKDMESGRPMSRLLEGDVGSGKTAVAAVASFVTARTRPPGQNFGSLQVAYMAPTEILAEQHFLSFISFFRGLPVPIALITGSGAKKFPSKVSPEKPTDISRAQLKKWVSNGEIPIVIGTHALIQKSVQFKHLALVVIDEQHRFGIEQRSKLAKKDGAFPHLLSMTATPIPRTLALTLYGDLDLSLLDELPEGRKPAVTEIVTPGKRDGAYEKIKGELSQGRQVYVICPRIDEPDLSKELALNAKSVKSEAKRLGEKVFPEYEIEILHGKMTPREKERVMKDWSEGKINILVATSVVEVGVNVPNATMIVIEGAERFGLAQLHQLRGRVLRSSHQAYCFLFSETKSGKSVERLKALATAKNGFELAELDLALRGPGELTGFKQWGISDIGMEAIRNIKMVEMAREEARGLAEKDPELSSYPLLKEKTEKSSEDTHFE